MNTRRASARSFYLKTKKSITNLPHFFADRYALGVKLIKNKPQDDYNNALSSEGESLNEDILCSDYDTALSSEDMLSPIVGSSAQTRDRLEDSTSCTSGSIFSSISIGPSSESGSIVARSKKEQAEFKLEIRLNLWIANNYGKKSRHLPLSMIKELVDRSPRSKLAHKFNEMRQVNLLISEENISGAENKKPTV